MEPGGYAWWYVDGVSHDGRHALTLIAFVGSVFSPYYAWSGRRDPLDHCALNVALYGPGGRWAMTERRREAVRRSRDVFVIGPSSLAWSGGALTFRIEEVAAPLPSRIRGQVVIRPEAVNTRGFVLDRRGRHVWRPIAPRAAVEVRLDSPALSWSGSAYLDCNAGREPLEEGFTRWTWARAALRRDAAVLYDVVERDGGRHGLALRFRPDGSIDPVEPPPVRRLPTTRWLMPQETRSDGAARVTRRCEDAPFYARSQVAASLLGEEAIMMHETLSLDRFRSPVVKAMLPFRMPRALGRGPSFAEI
ncbi:carotenoid 1,2-hydratase [Alsobacter sp. KACC 23698]|uniref:Carotenoid 1,2-hydratase n=1 Tax=Alsobacter sp. KACC 23698 TaxID=3149229 RepID=A0AAU7JE64_9HYPH